MADPERVITSVTIECECGETIEASFVSDAEVAHLRHLLDDHDIPEVNRAQYRAILARRT